MTSSTKLLSVKVYLTPRRHFDFSAANIWRERHKVSTGYSTPEELLRTIARNVRIDSNLQYPYHKVFAYDEINKATKRHGT